MYKLAIALVTTALIAASPAMAQHHDTRGPQARPGPSAQQHPKYREITQSRGHRWRKGQRLSANDRRYVVSDWNQRGLRAPPRGYQWVREGNDTGDFLLVATATGLIASILAQ